METLQNSKCVDTRLGGHPLWYTFVRDDIDMRVPDEFKDCVVFVGRQQKYKNQLRFQAVGTGFLVALGDSSAASPYLVTARHVAEDCRSKFFIRTNTTEGKYRFIASETNPKWYFHPSEENVDVAVYPWVPPEDTSRKFLPEQMFLTDEMIKKKNIGVGDALIVVGLFSQHEGRTRNEPIIRTGNIAMLPTEKIAVKGYG